MRDNMSDNDNANDNANNNDSDSNAVDKSKAVVGGGAKAVIREIVQAIRSVQEIARTSKMPPQKVSIIFALVDAVQPALDGCNGKTIEQPVMVAMDAMLVRVQKLNSHILDWQARKKGVQEHRDTLGGGGIRDGEARRGLKKT